MENYTIQLNHKQDVNSNQLSMLGDLIIN